MKRVFVLTMALCLAITMTVTGQDLTGKMLAGGYAGYTLGLGDPFGTEDFELMGVKVETKFDAGISFGGTFHYGVTEKLLIGGELGFQSYKSEVKTDATTIMGVPIPATDESASETKMNILATGLYALNYTDDENALFVTFGLGLYGGLGDGDGGEIGLNGGVLYRKMVSETVGVYVMPRIHYVMSDPAAKMLQIAVGVQMPLGSE
ncbi:MAG: hypothetical protein KAU35_06930 [candidate division Zixibacteria bacterium]|nr:hypothetical protein [candidate division Zixibacteria bacterium]